MSGGLLPAPAARKRGRPKGSTNRRPRELAGLVGALYGGSTAQHLAAFCMVTRGELKAAGGSMGKAQVAKAAELVEHVRRAQGARDEALRQVVREELRGLELGPDLAKAIRGALTRIREAGSGFGMSEALQMLAKARADLLPYTDQRQPLAIEAKGVGFAPSVVVQVEQAHQVSAAEATDAEFVEVFSAAPAQVARSKSHGEGQDIEGVDLFGGQAAD